MTTSSPKSFLLAAAVLAAFTTARAGVPAEARAVIDARGGVHRVAPSAGRGAEYGHCAAGCSAAPEAKVTFELEAPVSRVAVTLDAAGRPHLALETRHRVHYAACEGDCTKRSGWRTTVAVEHGGQFALDPEGFEVAPDGAARLRITPRADASASTQAFVATCAADCLDAARWTPHLERRAAQAAPLAASR